MKKINQFTVGALMIATLGITSCVEDEISPEVKAIYENQAAYLKAQANLKQAEADIEAANAAAKIAQNEVDILKAQNDLEIAREKHIKALLELKLEVEATKTIEAEKYLGKYLSEKGAIIGLESDLSSENIMLAKLNATNADGVFDKDEAIALKDLEIAQLTSQLEDDKSKLTLLEAVSEDATSVGNQVLEIQKQIDAIKAENKEKTARINEISNTELPTYGNDMQDYQDAKTNVQTEKANVQVSIDALSTMNESLTEAQTELAELTGGATITYEAALLSQSNAQSDYEAKPEVFNDISSLSGEYTTLINKITNTSATITANENLIENIENNLVIYESEYNQTKTIFDNNPSGYTVTNVGTDGRAGNANDNFSVTYYEVIDDTTTPVTYGNTPFYSYADLPNGSTVGNSNGNYYNVEVDDTVVSNQNAFNNAQSNFVNAQVNLSNAKANLAEAEAELILLQEKQAEFDSTLTAQVETARTNKDAAEEALTLADNIVTQLQAITSIENNILDTETNLEEANQRLAKAEGDVTRLGTLVGDAKLAEYIALLDQIDALGLEVSLNNKTINNLQGDIFYFNGLELELDATNYSGSDYEARMEKITKEIKDQKATVLATTKSIAKATETLEELKQDKAGLEATRLADIAAVESEIKRLQDEIDQRVVLAANYLTLMNNALI